MAPPLGLTEEKLRVNPLAQKGDWVEQHAWAARMTAVTINAQVTGESDMLQLRHGNQNGAMQECEYYMRSRVWRSMGVSRVQSSQRTTPRL